MKALIPDGWREALGPALETESFRRLEAFLEEEAAAGRSIWPPRARIFAALQHTPLERVKVVVLGQDPYPTFGVANGLCFSVAPGAKVPPSLKNIFKAIEFETGAPIPASGDLTGWAEQGVLLLNTVLTVREGEPNSHRGKGWEELTRAVLEQVNRREGPVVFLCLGKQAREMAEELVDLSKHAIVSTPHPSPLTGSAFMDCVKKERPFTRVNAILREGGRAPIDWSARQV